MPFDGRTFKETKPDVFSLEGLIAWLETQDAEVAYCYHDSGRCLHGRYLTAIGISFSGVGGDYWRSHDGAKHPLPGGDGTNYLHVASRLPYTFGAALERARDLLASRSAS